MKKHRHRFNIIVHEDFDPTDTWKVCKCGASQI